jgi:hypothetical protein
MVPPVALGAHKTSRAGSARRLVRLTAIRGRMVTVADDVYLMLVDGKVQAVDLAPMMRRHRARAVKARADAIDQAADLLMDEAFDPGETWDAAEAQGMPAGAIDAAGNVALALSEIEQLRWD